MTEEELQKRQEEARSLGDDSLKLVLAKCQVTLDSVLDNLQELRTLRAIYQIELRNRGIEEVI